MSPVHSVNVDTHFDFIVAEASFNYPEYSEKLSVFNGLIDIYKARE